MSDAVVTLIAGLGGALIGATAAVGGQILAHRQAREGEQRQELIELTARLWECADRLWRASEGLEHAITGLMGSDRPGAEDRRAHYEEQRQDTMQRHHDAETQGRFIAAQMRLRKLAIHQQATALLDASTLFEHHERDALRQRRDRAVGEYEAAAQSLLGV